jgi:orotate phosphoribosyltransferase
MYQLVAGCSGWKVTGRQPDVIVATVLPATESVLELFRFTGAYLEGHFRLTSGLHSDRYLQCALVLEHPTAAEKLGKMLAGVLQPNLAAGAGVVVSPALGGLIIGHEVARALGCRHIFTERDPESRKMVLRRGFSVQPGEIACVVEDVITTGGSTLDVISVVQGAGARVAAAGSIIDRSGGTADVGVPLVALASFNVAAYKPEECPLCRQGIRLEKPGSRPA